MWSVGSPCRHYKAEYRWTLYRLSDRNLVTDTCGGHNSPEAGTTATSGFIFIRFYCFRTVLGSQQSWVGNREFYPWVLMRKLRMQVTRPRSHRWSVVGPGLPSGVSGPKAHALSHSPPSQYLFLSAFFQAPMLFNAIEVFYSSDLTWIRVGHPSFSLPSVS